MPFLAPLIASVTASLISFGTTIGLSAAAAASFAAGVLNFGSSLLLSAISNALFGAKQPSAQDIARELSQSTTEPTYRFVYGDARATGTPVGTPVRGQAIYGCWLLNSRPSALPDFKLFMDKREVLFTGDPFDFSGLGGDASQDPFQTKCRFWVSRGDQTLPPDEFLADAAYAEPNDQDLWKATDGWQGRTVIWMLLISGPSGERQERWPSTPPLVEVEGKWSLIYDPREVSHDPDDPDTWEWSENHALCVRDALRQNPIRAYQESGIHSSFNQDGPDLCDEDVDRKTGGPESRYVLAGTQTFVDGEIEDLINPMVLSGAADLIRIGGQIGYAGGGWRGPTASLTYLLGDGFEFSDMDPGDELVNELRVSYISRARGFETAELQPWPIPGALDADGGLPAVQSLDLKFCPSATQGMRVRSILGKRLRRQERISGGELPPEAFDLVGGATASLSLPAPYDALDGIYEVQSIYPGVDPLGESGKLALRMPAKLIKHSEDIYDWTPAADEEDVYDEVYDGARTRAVAPGAISVVTGDTVNLTSGSTVIPRIRFAFDPSPSASVTGYEWEYSPLGVVYTTGGVIGADVLDGSDQVFAFFTGGLPGYPYDLRVRAVGTGGQSDWSEILYVNFVVNVSLDIPISGSATGAAGEITVSFRTPNDTDFRAIEFYGSDTDDIGAATIVGSQIFTAQNTTVQITETGLGTSVTRYYFARSRGEFGSASDFTASVTATTPS